MNTAKLAFISLAPLAVVGSAACKGRAAGPPTASDRKAFLGVSDLAAQARDAAKFSASQKHQGAARATH